MSLGLFGGGGKGIFGVKRGTEVPLQAQDRGWPVSASGRWLGTGPAAGRVVLRSSA